jgi:hypothetical protein
MKFNLLRDFSTRSFLFLLLCIAGAGNLWGEEYELITSTNELVAGDKYIIASMKSGDGFVMAKYVPNENNCGQIEATSANNKITYITDMALLTLGGSSGNWVFHDGTYYMTATNTKSANHLKGVKNVDGYHEFSISINSSGIATIKCKGKDSHNYLRHNSDSEIFSCYKSGSQSPVYLYKEVKNTNKEITSIAITGTPAVTTYYVGDSPSAEGLVVTAKYSDNSTENVTDKTQWEFTPATIEQDTRIIEAKASYNGRAATTVYPIALSSIANTENEPYNISQACSLINNGKGLCEEVYVKGIVSNIGDFQNGSITYYISNGGTQSTQQFVCYMGKNTNTADFTSTDDLKIGSSVIVKGLLEKNGETYGFKENNTLIKQNTLTSISISGAATQTKYIAGDTPNADGLTVNATYSDGSNKDVTGYVAWSFNPEVINKENESITATANYLGMTASYSIPISVDNIVYNLTPVEGGTSAYNDAGTTGILINGVNWFVYGNTETPTWKIGGKSIEKQDRHIKTSTPIYGTVEKIVVNVGGTSGDITLNSIKLSVANNASFTNSTNYDITDNLKANKDYVFQITPTENAYYRITYNLTVSGSNNKYYELKGAQFLGTSASYTLNVSDAGFATLCLPYNAVVPEGVVAYSASENGEYIRLTAIPDNRIAANEGVVLQASCGEYSFTSTYKQATEITDNLLIGVTNETTLTAESHAYMLTRKKEDGSVAFRLLNTNYTLGANKAYLKLKESDNARDVISVQWDDDETGIIETMTLDNNKETVIYNLSGQKLKQTQKGINIINGKLVIR